MNKTSFLLLTAISITVTSFAQSTEDSVKQVVNNLFIGMKASNGAMIAAAFADSAVLQTISRDKPSGKIGVRNE